jgi:hypothetical protein
MYLHCSDWSSSIAVVAILTGLILTLCQRMHARASFRPSRTFPKLSFSEKMKLTNVHIKQSSQTSTACGRVWRVRVSLGPDPNGPLVADDRHTRLHLQPVLRVFYAGYQTRTGVWQYCLYC